MFSTQNHAKKSFNCPVLLFINDKLSRKWGKLTSDFLVPLWLVALGKPINTTFRFLHILQCFCISWLHCIYSAYLLGKPNINMSQLGICQSSQSCAIAGLQVTLSQLIKT